MARHFGGIHQNRNSDRARAVVFAAIFFVIVFSVLAFYLLSTTEGPTDTGPVVVEREAEIKMVDVLVPLREIEPGTALEPTMFRKDSRPAVGVSDRTVKDFEEIRGHFARALIVAGQPLHRDFITSIRPINQLTANIPDGYRAVTIHVDKRTSVEGFVRPGAKVDVVWASRIRGRPGVTVIVQNAKVLSAERATQEAANNPGIPVPTTVTLLVTSQDAAKIQLASTTGSLSLQLRGDEDKGKDVGSPNSGSITIDDLLGGPKPQRDQRNVEGSITLGGEKFLLIDGRMVPESRKNRK